MASGKKHADFAPPTTVPVSPKRILQLSWESFGDRLPARASAPENTLAWFNNLLGLFLPDVNHLAQLPAKAAFIFGFDPEAARSDPANAAVLANDATRSALGEFGARVRTHSGAVHVEDFEIWMTAISAATGIQGEDLLRPVRIALTGSHSGPELDQVIPLIEDGAALNLGIPCIQDRVEWFVGG